MTAKNLFIYQMILSLGFGVALLFVPKMLTDMYGTPHTDTTGTVETLSRAYGSLLVAFGILAYMMRDTKPSAARYAFLVSVFIGSLLVSIVHVRAIFLGFENSSGWLTALLTIIAAVWSGFLMSKEDRTTLE